MRGIADADPIIHIRDLVHRESFSYLSARIPPIIPDERPNTDKITEFTKEY